MRKCRIHDNKESGVSVYEQGQGLIEDCEIVANTFSGVEVKTGGAPTVRKCRINGNQSTASGSPKQAAASTNRTTCVTTATGHGI